MINIDWANPDKTIILWQNQGAMTSQEYAHALQQSAALAESVDHTVGVIMDMRRAAGLPKNSFLLSRQVVEGQPKNMKITVLVSNSTFWEKVWGMMSRFHPATHINIQFTTSIDEAYRLINEQLEPSI
jgi:hypothetical protein